MKIVLKVANPATPKNFVEIVNSTSNICNIFESKKKRTFYLEPLLKHLRRVQRIYSNVLIKR
jgi:hypothetical protein